MATVTGLTAERMIEIEDASVVDGEIIAGHLILTKHDGSQIDAGSVVGPEGPIGPEGPSGAILGSVIDWPWRSNELPTEYAILYGQAISRTTYADLQTLAAAAGYPYGNGNGSTTFNIPDYRSRVGVGIDNMGGSAAGRITVAISGINGQTLGATLGDEGITLSTAQMPVHNHGISDVTHAHSYTAPINLADYQNAGTNYQYSNNPGAATTGASYSGISGTQNEGSGSAHRNMPPGIMVNKAMRIL